MTKTLVIGSLLAALAISLSWNVQAGREKKSAVVAEAFVGPQSFQWSDTGYSVARKRARDAAKLNES